MQQGITGDAKREASRMEERRKNKIKEIMKEERDGDGLGVMRMNVATRRGSRAAIPGHPSSNHSSLNNTDKMEKLSSTSI